MSASIPPGTEFAWEEGERKLEQQLAHAESLDSKATTLLGFLAVSVGIAASSLGKVRHWGRPVAIAALLVLALAAVLLGRAFWVRAYERSPSPQDVYRFAAEDRAWIQHRQLRARWAALSKNSEVLETKARFIKQAIVVLAADGALVLVAAIVKLV